MTGLSVLYTQEATKEAGWNEIPDRDKVGRLREVYWAEKTESKQDHTSFIDMGLTWRPDRKIFGRKADLPGDGFLLKTAMYPKHDERFEWIEVTEVFTSVPAKQINDAMKAWNGILKKRPVDFSEFRKSLNKERPSRAEQRKAADKTIQQIERKLAKASYRELMEKYGYGTLVAGLPLWFATFPDDPWRVKNALDDFFTRTALGLEDLERKILRRSDCPFRQIIVVWDTSPEALQEWDEKKSSEYEDAANTSLENPVSAAKLGSIFSQTLNKVVPDLGLEESDIPSFSLKIKVQTGKNKMGKGPYPELIALHREIADKSKDKSYEIIDKLKLWLTQVLCQLLCFVRIHGFGGLERRILRKISIPHVLKVWVARQRTRSLYMESRSRRISEDTCSDKD